MFAALQSFFVRISWTSLLLKCQVLLLLRSREPVMRAPKTPGFLETLVRKHWCNRVVQWTRKKIKHLLPDNLPDYSWTLEYSNRAMLCHHLIVGGLLTKRLFKVYNFNLPTLCLLVLSYIYHINWAGLPFVLDLKSTVYKKKSKNKQKKPSKNVFTMF